MARTATAKKDCECGAPLQDRKQKCKTCRLSNHPASSQCPFCLEWYWTHRGLGEDKQEMYYHASGRCGR